MLLIHSLPLSVLKKQENGKSLYHFICEAPPSLCESYQQAGQYLSLSPIENSENGGFFALGAAPTPRQTQLEFLIKWQKDQLPEELCKRKEGEVLFACKQILGEGFGKAFSSNKLSDYHAQRPKKPKSLHLFSMGSGLAPLRAVLQSILQDWARLRRETPDTRNIDFSNITLWQGSHSKDSLPFHAEYSKWLAQGVNIELCLSKVEGTENLSSLSNLAGKININKCNIVDALAQKRPDLRGSLACWVGSSDFGKSLCGRVNELGMVDSDLHDNFS